MRLLDRPSPNHDERPAADAVDMLVLHYTGNTTFKLKRKLIQRLSISLLFPLNRSIVILPVKSMTYKTFEVF